MRFLLPIFTLVAVIALNRSDWFRGLSSTGGRAATKLAGSGSRFGFGPGRGIGAVRAKAAKLGGPSVPLSRRRSVEGRQKAVAEVPQDAGTTHGVDPDPLRSAATAKARRGPLDGTHGVHEPRARFEEARGQPVRRPSPADDVSMLEELAFGNWKERRAGGVASDAVSQSTQGGAESRRRTARHVMRASDDVGSEATEAVLGTTEDAPRPAALLSAAEGGLRDMQQGMMGLIEGVARTNLRLTRELFRMSDPAALVELQHRSARGYTDALLQGGATVARAVRRTADETLRPLDRQIERQRDEAGNQDKRRL